MPSVERVLTQQETFATIHPTKNAQRADGEPAFVGQAVSIIVPAYNEERGVGPQVESIHRAMDSHCIKHEVIVIDDGSNDQTAENALRLGARVLRHPENRGYGASIKTGILAARHDLIVIIDADGTYPADQIPQLAAKLDSADMVVGARVGKEVHVPWMRRAPKGFLRWLAVRIAGKPIPDLNSVLRAFRRGCVLQYFPVLSNQFSFTTTVTLALLSDGYSVIYHPIDYYQRIGKSKIVPWHFMDFTLLVLRMAMLFQPLKIFLPTALACGILGLMKVGLDVAGYFVRSGSFGWSFLYQPVLSTSAVLLLLTGFQLLLIGMLADGVLRRMSLRNASLEPSHGIQVWHSDSDPASQVPES